MMLVKISLYCILNIQTKSKYDFPNRGNKVKFVFLGKIILADCLDVKWKFMLWSKLVNGSRYILQVLVGIISSTIYSQFIMS